MHSLSSAQFGGANRQPSIMSVVGLQDSGKTRLVSQMVQIWTKLGLRVAVVKHDGHAGHTSEIDWEKPGSDTTQFGRAGAEYTLIAGGGQSMLRVAQDGDADDVEALCTRLTEVAAQAGRPLDMIVVEGFKRSGLAKVVPLRREADYEWLRRAHLANLRAVVCTDNWISLADGQWPVYHENEVARLCNDIWAER